MLKVYEPYIRARLATNTLYGSYLFRGLLIDTLKRKLEVGYDGITVRPAVE